MCYNKKCAKKLDKVNVGKQQNWIKSVHLLKTQGSRRKRQKIPKFNKCDVSFKSTITGVAKYFNEEKTKAKRRCITDIIKRRLHQPTAVLDNGVLIITY